MSDVIVVTVNGQTQNLNEALQVLQSIPRQQFMFHVCSGYHMSVIIGIDSVVSKSLSCKGLSVDSAQANEICKNRGVGTHSSREKDYTHHLEDYVRKCIHHKS